ncbi:hypothetical protein Q5P01_021860 [Channa striata]|uniref:Ig-like domain-containing protein n=1 Tax=Channa striata TaxID=64152 RepID=A0AA88LV02_CHASR|nr:hypothetical protein Q5P01_021860 [Channa striata]
METQTAAWLTAVLPLVLLTSALAEKTSVYFVIGGSLTLTPPVAPGRISRILWKHDENLVAEWADGRAEPRYSGTFRGRAGLDTTTGRLDITNVTEADAGMFTLDINNALQGERYEATVIHKVPKPEILVQPLRCSSGSDSCTLTCEGNITEAEPVTYSWKMGAGDWTESEQSINISSTEGIQSVTNFTCRMTNPVSEEQSEVHPNPFFQRARPSSRRWLEVFLTVLKVVGVVSLVWALVYFVWRNRDAACPCVGGKGENAAQSG